MPRLLPPTNVDLFDVTTIKVYVKTEKVCISRRDRIDCVAMDDVMQRSVDKALRILRQKFRTYGAAADELGITRQALRDWRAKGRVSVRRVKRVSELTGIPKHELRPDIFDLSDDDRVPATAA